MVPRTPWAGARGFPLDSLGARPFVRPTRQAVPGYLCGFGPGRGRSCLAPGEASNRTRGTRPPILPAPVGAGRGLPMLVWRRNEGISHPSTTSAPTGADCFSRVSFPGLALRAAPRATYGAPYRGPRGREGGATSARIAPPTGRKAIWAITNVRALAPFESYVSFGVAWRIGWPDDGPFLSRWSYGRGRSDPEYAVRRAQ